MSPNNYFDPNNDFDYSANKASRGKHAKHAKPQRDVPGIENTFETPYDSRVESRLQSRHAAAQRAGSRGSRDTVQHAGSRGSLDAVQGAGSRGSRDAVQGAGSSRFDAQNDRSAARAQASRSASYGYPQVAGSGRYAQDQRAGACSRAGQAAAERAGAYSPDLRGYDASADASMYSRTNSRYESGSPRDIAMPKKRKGRGKKIVLGVLIALLVVVGIASAAGIWYFSRLDAALSKGEDVAAKEVLAASDEGSAFYMLVLGSDSREGSGTSKDPSMSGDQQRSDVMLLLRIDPTAKSVTMMSIPRDTPYGYDQTLGKINEAYNKNGPSGSIAAVSELTGLPITHYAEVHISELENIVDAVGGVTVSVDQELTVKDTLTGEYETIYPGTQTLDGQQAQVFARARKQYSDGDVSRQNNVRTLVMAIAQKVIDRPVAEIPDTVIDLAQYVGTDLKSGDLVSLAMSFAGGSIKQTTIKTPTAGESCEYTDDLWICYVNPDGWDQAVESLKAGSQSSDVDFSSTEYMWSQELREAMIAHGANQEEAVASLGASSSTASGASAGS